MADQAEAVRRNDLYETDFLAWTEQQARALEEGRWTDVDAANMADEIAGLGRQVVREAGERLEILMSYLLNWRHLAEYRGRAWKENIARQRQELADLLRENPSMGPDKEKLVAESYDGARRRLKYETYFFESDFPASCPFTVEQVFDDSFFPEELDAPATGAFPTARRIA
jgi:hypothetical protein